MKKDKSVEVFLDAPEWLSGRFDSLKYQEIALIEALGIIHKETHELWKQASKTFGVDFSKIPGSYNGTTKKISYTPE